MTPSAVYRAFGWMLALVLGAPAPTLAEPRATPAVHAASAPLLLRDDRGVEHRFDTPPQRIVSLLPSLTECVWVLGGGSRLIGVDRHSNWPPELSHLPRLGDLEHARIEAIARLKPDVVIASLSSRALDRLEALGVRVLRYRTDSHADARRTLHEVAALLGTPGRAVAEWTRIERAVDAAAVAVPPRLRGARVYFEIGGGPYAAGATSFIGETLARLHLDNVVPRDLGPFPKLNPEFVVRARPQVVMAAARDVDTLALRPGWRTLPAVQQRRWCGFTPSQIDVLVRPGPRIGEAAAIIAACLEGLPA